MTDTRGHFHQELAGLESAALEQADHCERLVGMAVEALATSDTELADRVLREGREVQERYKVNHDRWINVMARQQPMGGDLRLMSSILHLNVTLDRTAAQCMNIARLVPLTENLPSSERVMGQIQEMADLVRPMLRTAAGAFLRRDADEARLLPAMDEPVDRINRNMYREVVDCGPDSGLLEWATHMMMTARALERIGDQAVDMGEQVVFLVTGEYQGFSDQQTTASGERA
jgi:phosphate transport system protein